MDINYLILAHRNPLQIRRQIERLSTATTKFYVHVDANVDVTPFSEALKGLGPVCLLEGRERHAAVWGSMGIVEATLSLLRKSLEHTKAGFCLLLSGQDYPLQSNQAIADHLEKRRDTSFMTCDPLPPPQWGAAHTRERIEFYRIQMSPKKYDYVLLPWLGMKEFYRLRTLPALARVLKARPLRELGKFLSPRRPPRDLVLYGGEQWWALTVELAREVLKFVEGRPDCRTYHQDSLIPDEMFFHTIVKHLERDGGRFKLEPGLHYTHWSCAGAPSPATFKIGDYASLVEARKLKFFARKFDQSVDHEVLMMLDELLLA